MEQGGRSDVSQLILGKAPAPFCQRMTRPKLAEPDKAEEMKRFFFLLGARRSSRFVEDVFLAVYASPASDPFWGYPPWLVVLGLTLAAALAIWILGKLLKFALWLLFFAVLIGGIGWALWLLLQ